MNASEALTEALFRGIPGRLRRAASSVDASVHASIHPGIHRAPILRLLRGLGVACWLALATVDVGALPQGERPKRPDQVMWRNRRGQETKQAGTVTENSLAQVVIEVEGRSRTMESGSVAEIEFGDVPPAYQDGVAYAARGDHENAAAKFRLAAGDPSARDVVKASARLEAAMALKDQGATDANAFVEAKAEYERFLADHPDNREVPRARFFLARMQRLTGDAKTAAETYRSLYKEAAGAGVTPGYSPQLCFQAGLAAAESFLVVGDTLQAREIYAEMDSLIPRALGEIAVDDAGQRAEFERLQAQARLGEGYCLLAGGSVSQAKTFFEGQLRNAGARDVALRNGARLGLAETLLAEGKLREAQIEFATVSAIDHTDPDRVARALVGLAECALKLSDANARTDARLWIQTVKDHYGDTPSVRKAQELSQTL